MSKLNLSDLKIQKSAVITEIKPDKFNIILKERGFNIGEEITLLHSDIFHDVKIFLINQSKYALRKSEYELIEIKLI